MGWVKGHYRNGKWVAGHYRVTNKYIGSVFRSAGSAPEPGPSYQQTTAPQNLYPIPPPHPGADVSVLQIVLLGFLALIVLTCVAGIVGGPRRSTEQAQADSQPIRVQRWLPPPSTQPVPAPARHAHRRHRHRSEPAVAQDAVQLPAPTIAPTEPPAAVPAPAASGKD
jgi:hypothetical protein